MSEATEKSPVIRLDAHDNVVVARVPIAKGTVLHPENIVVQSDIPLGHKLATCAIAKDEPVRKYNTIIGYATRDVVPGTHMHNDTIRFDHVEHPTDFCEDYHPVELLAPEQRRTYRGYVRRGVGRAFEHWPAVRWFRRVFLRLGQPGAGKSDGYSCAQWRYGLPFRDDGAVQCGGSAHPPRQIPRDWRASARSAAMVAGLLQG